MRSHVQRFASGVRLEREEPHKRGTHAKQVLSAGRRLAERSGVGGAVLRDLKGYWMEGGEWGACRLNPVASGPPILLDFNHGAVGDQ